MANNRSLLPLLFGSILGIGGIDTIGFDKPKPLKIKLPELPKETKRDWRIKKRKRILRAKRRERKQKRGY
jgi:hypothetical protein